MGLFQKKDKPKVTFATSCWERDYSYLLEGDYLQEQIARHNYPFAERIMIINNVKDINKAIALAEKKVKEKVITHYYIAEKQSEKILSFFQLKKKDFTLGRQKKDYPELNDDWVYYNALGPLAAIYYTTGDYLLYQTGDVGLDKTCSWIDKAITFMKRKKRYKVANLTWNENYEEVKEESFCQKKDFFLAKEGFSDQMFLVKALDMKSPIYSELREDASHFPRGEVFEKRVFSYMKNHNWRRLTYKYGSYIHPCP